MFNTYDIKVANPDYFKQLAVRDTLIVYYQCPQVEQHIKLFTHYNVIGFTISGKKILHHLQKSWVLTENKSVFIRRTAYKQEMVHLVGWEVLTFYFQDEFLKSFIREYRQYLPLRNIPDRPSEMLIEINVNDTTRAFFHSIIPYFAQKVPPAESLLELKFKELLLVIFQDPFNSNLLSYAVSIADQQNTPIPEIMEANFTFNLTITEFARIARRSVTSFKREFYEYYKMTPGKWLTKKRLEYAKMLLDSSSRKVNEIAYDSGFENITHFCRIFKDNYGLSPLQYRKNIP